MSCNVYPIITNLSIYVTIVKLNNHFKYELYASHRSGLTFVQKFLSLEGGVFKNFALKAYNPFYGIFYSFSHVKHVIFTEMMKSFHLLCYDNSIFLTSSTQHLQFL